MLVSKPPTGGNQGPQGAYRDHAGHGVAAAVGAFTCPQVLVKTHVPARVRAGVIGQDNLRKPEVAADFALDVPRSTFRVTNPNGEEKKR